MLLLFVVATLVPSVAMVWLGWQLLEQDRTLERQRTQDALEGTATHVAAGIARSLEAIERDLPSLVSGSSPLRSETSVAVHLTRAGGVAHAGAPLLFLPVLAPPAHEPPATVWVDVERQEFVDNDADAAARAYRALAASPDVHVRAGALLRLARVLKAAGRHEQALDSLHDAGGETLALMGWVVP